MADDEDDTTDTGSDDTSSDSGTGSADDASSTNDTAGSSDGESSTGSQGELPDWAKAQISKANAEAAKFRRERNEAKVALDKIKQAELSETEREKARADAAESELSKARERLQESNLRVAISTAQPGIVDVETTALLLSRQGVTFDDEGTPQDIDTALKTLVKNKPFLVGAVPTKKRGSANGGAGSTDDSGGSADLTADELSMAKAFKMTPEEYAKFKNRK